jgi:hypothetical protein
MAGAVFTDQDAIMAVMEQADIAVTSLSLTSTACHQSAVLTLVVNRRERKCTRSVSHAQLQDLRVDMPMRSIRV